MWFYIKLWQTSQIAETESYDENGFGNHLESAVEGPFAWCHVHTSMRARVLTCMQKLKESQGCTQAYTCTPALACTPILAYTRIPACMPMKAGTHPFTCTSGCALLSVAGNAEHYEDDEDDAG